MCAYSGDLRAAAPSFGLVRADAVVPRLGLHVAQYVAGQGDPALQPLHLPVVHRGEPAEDAAGRRLETPPAIHERLALGRTELETLLEGRAAEPDDVGARGLARHD